MTDTNIMEIAEWSRVIGILFWEKLAKERPEDGYDKYEKAGKLIDTVKGWMPHVINIPDEHKLGFTFPSDPDEKAFYKARDLFVLEWNSALEDGFRLQFLISNPDDADRTQAFVSIGSFPFSIQKLIYNYIF